MQQYSLNCRVELQGTSEVSSNNMQHFPIDDTPACISTVHSGERGSSKSPLSKFQPFRFHETWDKVHLETLFEPLQNKSTVCF